MNTVTIEDADMKKPTATGAKHARMTVAEYIGELLDQASAKGKTQKMIASELGYKLPNMISMMRREDVKVPLDKVPALARALECDPVFLFRLAAQQYIDSDDPAFVEIFGRMVTDNELVMLERYRAATKGADPVLTKDQLKALGAAVK